MIAKHGGIVRPGVAEDANSTDCHFHASTMELAMSDFSKLTCFVASVLAVTLGGLQYKTLSPQIFEFVATTVALIGRTGFYDGAPVSFWNFAV